MKPRLGNLPQHSHQSCWGLRSSSIENGFALPPIEDFEKAITPRTKAIVICNPNNPTGYLYSREEMEVLKQLLIKHDLVHAVWSPLVELTRMRHLHYRRQLVARESTHAGTPGNVVAAGV